jgi:hypothetical protein
MKLKNMKNKITVNLYAKKYSENELAKMILNKEFGFELSIESDTERSRRILSFEEALSLKDSLDQAFSDYKKYSFLDL